MRRLFRLNTFLNSVNGLETLLQDLLLCNLITVDERWKNIGSVSESIQFQKFSHLSFAKSLFEILYA